MIISTRSERKLLFLLLTRLQPQNCIGLVFLLAIVFFGKQCCSKHFFLLKNISLNYIITFAKKKSFFLSALNSFKNKNVISRLTVNPSLFKFFLNFAFYTSFLQEANHFDEKQCRDPINFSISCYRTWNE